MPLAAACSELAATGELAACCCSGTPDEPAGIHDASAPAAPSTTALAVPVQDEARAAPAAVAPGAPAPLASAAVPVSAAPAAPAAARLAEAGHVVAARGSEDAAGSVGAEERSPSAASAPPQVRQGPAGVGAVVC